MITFPKKIMKTRELTEFGLALGYLRKVANKKGIAWKAGEGKQAIGCLTQTNSQSRLRKIRRVNNGI